MDVLEAACAASMAEYADLILKTCVWRKAKRFSNGCFKSVAVVLYCTSARCVKPLEVDSRQRQSPFAVLLFLFLF